MSDTIDVQERVDAMRELLERDGMHTRIADLAKTSGLSERVVMDVIEETRREYGGFYGDDYE